MVSFRPQATLAQRKLQLVSDELTEAALQLLARKGFDLVTVDEIVAAAGVSKRTFFRHFASKEDVVIRFLAGMGPDIRTELASRPSEEQPSVALRHAVWVPIASCAGHSERTLRVIQLIMDTPALRARFLERQAQWRNDVTTTLAHRLGLDPGNDLYPELATGMVFNAFDAVLQRWSASGGAEDLAKLTDRAFAVISPALDNVANLRADTAPARSRPRSDVTPAKNRKRPVVTGERLPRHPRR